MLKNLLTRFEAIRNNRLMFKEVITLPILLKSAVQLNYYRMLYSGKAPDVLNIDLKVTKRCNASCSFCFTEVTKGPAEEMSLDDIKKFVRSFGKSKIAFFLTGGEPFIRADIFEIIKIIKEQGSSCGIVTNGSVLSDNSLAKLIDCGLDNIVFSLHGIGVTNDSILKLRGTSIKVLDKISKIRKMRHKNKSEKPYIVINSVMNLATANEYKSLIREGDNAGADTIRFSHPSFIYPHENNSHFVESKKRFGCMVKTSQYVSAKNPTTGFSTHEKGTDPVFGLINEIKGFSRKLRTNIKVCTYPNLSSSELKGWYSHKFRTSRECYYTYSSSFINEVGEVYPCQFYQVSMGNIKENEFSEIWNNGKYKKFRNMIKKELLPGCSRCCKLF